VQQLQGEGLNAVFHQLDITNPHSIQTIRDFTYDIYEGVDILVNNAGVDFRVLNN